MHIFNTVKEESLLDFRFYLRVNFFNETES